MNITHPMLGADPEFFVANAQLATIPIFGLLGGTKDKPIPLGNEKNGYFFQEDGAAGEFNIPPANNYERFCTNIDFMVNELTKKLARGGYSITGQSRIVLTPEYLQDARSQTIGCIPDRSAYGDQPGAEREAFTAEQLGDKRFAGGHFHVQYNKSAFPEFAAARFCDVVAGLPSVRLDKQQERRQFYGQPGLFRIKDYGIEYRSLSNFWLFARNKAYLASNLLHFAGMTFQPRGCAALQKAFGDIPWMDVHAAINNEDEKLAQMLIDFVNIKCDFRVALI